MIFFLKHKQSLYKLDVVEIKTVAENWDSKTPSVGTILAYLETTA